MESKLPITQDTSEKKLSARTRRGFLTLGAGAVAGAAGWTWLRTRPDEDETPWPLRRGLAFNRSVAQSYFSGSHLAPVFSKDQIGEAQVNGDVGIEDEVDLAAWTLNVSGHTLRMPDIMAFPRSEHITQFKCIEGWSYIAHWAGVKFSDFAAKYPPQDNKFVSMRTPDNKYFVGLDIASAMHPQTLLAYELNGKPLTSDHGAPLRLIIPVKYGVKNIKRIGFIDYTNQRPEDYWAKEGYDWYTGL